MKRKPDALVILAFCFVVGALLSVAGPFFVDKTQAHNTEALLRAGVYSE